MRYSVFLLIVWSILISFYTHADNDPIIDSGLAVQRTCSLEAIWKDKGSGADLDGFFYLPYVDAAAFIIGGYGSSTKKLSPTDCVLTVSDEKHLIAPVDWELIWKDKGSGAKKDGSMWRAIPPDNDHVCIGTIPQEGYEKPILSNYRCVNAQFTEKVITNSLIWSDKGSGAKKKVTMFQLLNSGSFVAVEARLAQLETYDLKMDSALLGGTDEAEALIGANTQDRSEENGNNKIFGNLLSVKEEFIKNLAIQEGTAPPEDEDCYYDRGRKYCGEQNFRSRGFGGGQKFPEGHYSITDYNDFKSSVCEKNNGVENVNISRKELQFHPAAHDKQFGTIRVGCVSKSHVMMFGIDSIPENTRPNILLNERILLIQKFVSDGTPDGLIPIAGKTPILIVFNTDGAEGEFERQMNAFCKKNGIEFVLSKAY